MRKDAFMKPLSVVLAAVLCITPLVIKARAENWSWTKVANNSNLKSVDMICSADGWAVGYDGAISHWDGTRWNNKGSPTIANLRAVDMISPSEGWAIAGDISGYGNNNSIIRWDGGSSRLKADVFKGKPG